MNQTIKTPRTVVELGDVAEGLGVTLPQIMLAFERRFGPRWTDAEEITFVTPGVQDSGEIIPPEGYDLAPGCADYYVGARVTSSAFVITPSWHATTGLFSIELEPSDGLGDMQMLAPDEALKLAADITAVVHAITPVTIAAPKAIAAAEATED